MYINLMHIKILNLHTYMSKMQYLYDDMLLPQPSALQPLFDELHLVLHLNQHITIITYQQHHDDLKFIQWPHAQKP